jgi:proline-specific peptidase
LTSQAPGDRSLAADFPRWAATTFRRTREGREHPYTFPIHARVDLYPQLDRCVEGSKPDPPVFTSSTRATMPEGTVPFIVGDDAFSTWYKLVGELTSSKRPLVVLHGGPGLTHDYLIPIADLAAAGRPVILYDQIGNGRSSKASDKTNTFWTVDLMVAELSNLLRHLGIADDFDLLGHSWGGMLGLEFALRRAPRGLKHLVLSNSLARMASWDASCAEQLKEFPQDVQDGVAAGWDDPERLRAAMKIVTAVHYCRLKPQPPEYWYSLDQTFQDPRTSIAL